MRQVALVREPIDSNRLLQAVAHAECGAISLFVGTVRAQNDGRRVTGIEYSAYEAMAEQEMGRIADEALERFAGVRVVMEHRLGTLTVGEASIAIAAAHERRASSMNAMRYVIEEVKRRVPIWKRELYVDGTREWVDPTKGGGGHERDFDTEGGERVRVAAENLSNFSLGGAPLSPEDTP